MVLYISYVRYISFSFLSGSGELSNLCIFLYVCLYVAEVAEPTP